MGVFTILLFASVFYFNLFQVSVDAQYDVPLETWAWAPQELQKHVLQENHKPVFHNCAELKPSVKEEQVPGTFVIRISAIDVDPIDSGGKLKYSFVSGPDEKLKFVINQNTGVIRTNYSFDRDEPKREKEVYLTVRATDNGRPQLDAVCGIKVIIEDVNDNAPLFDKIHYRESVPQDLAVGREVMRLSATDIDDGMNSVVLYSLDWLNDDDKLSFSIDQNTGIIHLKNRIAKHPNETFELQATAEDQGEVKSRSSIKLEILILEPNKKVPSFTSKPTSPIIVEENFTDFTRNIATLTAASNTDENAPVYELVTGRTEPTNKYNTFRLESQGKTAHIRLSRPLDYEACTEYTITIRIQNKYNLAAETNINIQTTDVNDNIPVFTEMIAGVVLENEPPGTPVMQVHAIDADGSTKHNQVTYFLTDNLDNFQIDVNNGNITTFKTFDREEQDFYNVKVIAVDNYPSALYLTGEANRGQQVFQIEIADKNDHPPKFTRFLYIAEAIPEDANQNALVAEVKAVDKDSTSFVTYTIVGGDEDNVFMVEGKTGKIRVAGQLDFETKSEYSLKIKAFDGSYEDYCDVEIKIENVNDNPPQFITGSISVTIMEEEHVAGCIAQVEAYDPDIQNRNNPQHIVYFIVKKEQQKLLAIDKQGCLTMIKPLDRDPPSGYETWQIIISANDEDGGPTTLRSSTEIIITLQDKNDNAPFLDMDQPVFWKENQEPHSIVDLVAKDYDGPSNGDPFRFAISSEGLKSKFSITGATLRALVVFDREEIKSYNVPILISDSGSPGMTGTSMLTIVIADENDNPMKEGHSDIFVYNFKGEAPDTEIGRVYVDDPDDWDLPDKTFSWAENAHSQFHLNQNTGTITMLQGAVNQSFSLMFKVQEEGLKVEARTVYATVNITIKEIPEEAVDKSGSIRLAGITAEEFIELNNDGINKRTLLQTYLGKYLNVAEDNIDIFTVLQSPHNSDEIHLDLRFSVHGSPYYSSEKLNAAVSAHAVELQNHLNISIFMISIDECIFEQLYCENSCSNVLSKSSIPYPVYTNKTTFIGVRAVIDPVCSCLQPQIFVRNDKLHKIYSSIAFRGDGYALFHPIPTCDPSHLSVTIRSKSHDGLVFYLGPTSKPSSRGFSVQDFMSLELRNGFPVLLVDFGSGTVKIVAETKLNGRKTHRFDIMWSKTYIKLQVDNGSISERSRTMSPSRENELLNVNGPLQVGGSFLDFQKFKNHFNWTFNPTQIGFRGCIRNLTFNSEIYDLGDPGFSQSAEIGCSAEMSSIVFQFLVGTAVLVIILLSLVATLILFVVGKSVDRKWCTTNNFEPLMNPDDIRESIMRYEEEGGGERDVIGYDLSVLPHINVEPQPDTDVTDFSEWLYGIQPTFDKDSEAAMDDVRPYAYEGGDGYSTGSLSSLTSTSKDSDLDFNYLKNFGPRFEELANIYVDD